jgi:YfiH family protein
MTIMPGVVCAVMTADCLPVLLADKAGRVVGAAHAGWRGLAAGVLEALVHKMTERVNALPQDLVAWLGPAIGSEAFEVGDDVREAFIGLNPLNKACFKPGATGKWLADLSAIAAAKLQGMGVSSITPSGFCTYTQAERFYSFRRDQVTGRMATMIWIKP